MGPNQQARRAIKQWGKYVLKQSVKKKKKALEVVIIESQNFDAFIAFILWFSIIFILNYVC